MITPSLPVSVTDTWDRSRAGVDYTECQNCQYFVNNNRVGRDVCLSCPHSR